MNTLSRITILVGVFLLSVPPALSAEELRLAQVRSIQSVKSLNASLVNGRSFKEGTVEGPVYFAFYVAVGEPVTLPQKIVAQLTSDAFARSRVDDTEVMKMPLIEAGEYYVLLDKKKKVVCLLAKHDGNRMSLSRVVESGKGVYQNDPNSGMGAYYDFQFP